MSCHGFFHAGHKEFGNLLIRDCTTAVNISTGEEKRIQVLGAY
jgi:hypothetical protein